MQPDSRPIEGVPGDTAGTGLEPPRTGGQKQSDLCRLIRNLRYAKGLGSEELAALARISRTALHQIESGRTEQPRAATLLKLARALGVAPEDLMRKGVIQDGQATHSPGPILLADESQAGHAIHRDQEIDRQFRVLLTTFWREPLALIVECAYRILAESHNMQGS